MNSSKIVVGLWMMNAIRCQRRLCHHGGLSLVVVSNLCLRAVAAGAGFFAASPSSSSLSSSSTAVGVVGSYFRGGLRNLQPSTTSSCRSLEQFPFGQVQKAWLRTSAKRRGARLGATVDGDDSDGGNQGDSSPKSKNPFIGVVSLGEDVGDDDTTVSSRNRLLKQKKVKTTSSWMERNEAFSQETATEDSTTTGRSASRGRRGEGIGGDRRFDSSSSSSSSSPRRSSEGQRGPRSEYDGGDRRRSDFSGGGGDRRRSEVGGGGDRRRSDSYSGGGGSGERRRSEFGGGGGGSGDRRRSDYGGGGDRRRSDYGGGDRRQSSSSTSSSSFRREGGRSRSEPSFRRWDNQGDVDKPREWSSVRNGGGNNRGQGRNDDDNNNRAGKSFRQDFRGTRVFVQGLSPDTTWQQLKDHFRVAGEVVFASVSIDPNTGESKGHGIVQYETTEMASHAISVMREHPLDGETLYVRADVQESRSSQPERDERFATRSRSNSVSSERPYSSRSPSSSSSSSSFTSTPSAKWRCADEEYVELIPEEDQQAILNLIKDRDAARRQRDYDASDDLRAQLKSHFGVHVDDRLKMWWVSLDGKDVPTSIRDTKGDGRWGKAPSWRQIPTTEEHDACVNADLVNGLLAQRDIARKEKDFVTADKLLEQARTSPDGDLVLRIHDESRTWRIWTDEPPPRPRRVQKMGGGAVTAFAAAADRRSSPRKTPTEQCLDLVREHAPHKEEEIKLVLEKFQGREYKVLKKLKQRYLSSSSSTSNKMEEEEEVEEGELVSSNEYDDSSDDDDDDEEEKDSKKL